MSRRSGIHIGQGLSGPVLTSLSKVADNSHLNEIEARVASRRDSNLKRRIA